MPDLTALDQAQEALRQELREAIWQGWRVSGLRQLNGQQAQAFVDAVLPIVQRREQALRKQIEALADELDREARDWTRSAHSVNAKRDAAQRLRGLVSGDQGDTQ